MASLHLGTYLELFWIVVQVRKDYKCMNLDSFVVVWRGIRVVSGLPGALYSICLGVSSILESEKIVKMCPTND